MVRFYCMETETKSQTRTWGLVPFSILEWNIVSYVVWCNILLVYQGSWTGSRCVLSLSSSNVVFQRAELRRTNKQTRRQAERPETSVSPETRALSSRQTPCCYEDMKATAAYRSLFFCYLQRRLLFDRVRFHQTVRLRKQTRLEVKVSRPVRLRTAPRSPAGWGSPWRLPRAPYHWSVC